MRDPQARLLTATSALFLAALFVTCLNAPTADLDMWHEIALIRESLHSGRLLTHNVFGYTPAVDPVINHEWGAGAVLYLLTFGLGSWSIPLFKYILAFAAALFCVQTARARGATLPLLAVCGIAALNMFALGAATLRAQAYSFLFFAAVLYLLELDRRGRRFWIAPWLLMFPVWVNLHGGCIMGMVALGAHIVEQALRRKPFLHLLAVLLATAAVIGLNPYGFAYYRGVLHAVTFPRPLVVEWQPIWRFSAFYTMWFGAAVVASAYALLARGVRASHGSLLLVLTAAGTISHARVLPFFAIAFAALVPAILTETAGGKRLDRLVRTTPYAPAAAVAGTVACVLLLIRSGGWGPVAPADLFPVGAVRYLASAGFRGNVMTQFETGAYVTWHLYPAVRVSIDSRYEIAYPPEWANETAAFYAAQSGWRRTLSKYPADLVLTPREAPVAVAMSSTPWARVYADRFFAIYARPGLKLPVVEQTSRSFEAGFP